jgi:hypothetical protein
VWFELVYKNDRACVPPSPQEPNHHKTYVFLLETLAHKELSKMVLKTTYYYCR